MSALSFEANRDFLADLKGKHTSQVTPAMEQRAAVSALDWWDRYLRVHPDGDWRFAARDGLMDAGFAVEADLRSASSRASLLRAITAESEIARYAAYRLLNDAYGTHFDLEPAFMSGKYAMSFLDPSGEEKAFEERLAAHWTRRLQQQAP